MLSINSTSAQSTAMRSLNKSQQKITDTLKRLSTGLRINDGADDPAGLIASEAFRSEQRALSAGIDNAVRAGNVVGTAEAALAEVGSLLTELQSLVSQVASSGSMTQDEREAAQLEVDSTLGEIQKISNSTSFKGKKLLDGSLAYRTSGVVATSLTNVAVNSAKVPVGGSKAMNIAVQTAATRARVDYTGGTLAAGNNVTLEVAGGTGTAQVGFAAGSTTAQMATIINAATADTGVQATVVGGTLQIESSDFGSQQRVAVRALSGTYATTAVFANGTDAQVRVNGTLAGANGINVTYRDGDTDVSFALTTTSNVAAAATTFNITGGGADFMIGSKVSDANRRSLGIQSVAPTSLGDATVGFISTLRSGEANSLNSANLASAQKIADAAVKQVATMRGRLGLFQKLAVESGISNLEAQREAVTQAGGEIRDADYAAETAELTRQQILQEASRSAFAVANQQPQLALSLLASVR